MFKYIDLPTNDGRIRQAWNKLVRKIQTNVEHKLVTNAAPSPRDKGELVYAHADGAVAPTLATGDPTSEWVGVWAEPVAGNGKGIIRYQGYAYVKFEDLPHLTVGTAAYVSAAINGAGLATDVAPGIAKRIGTIANTTGYVGATNPYAWVWLGRCCTPLGQG